MNVLYSTGNPNLPAGPVAFLALALTIAGCGKNESPGPAAPATAPPALPSLQADAPPPPPGQGNATAPGGAATNAAATATLDFATAERPLNEAGSPMSDLELLNQALLDYNEARVTGGADSGQVRAYKTEAEQAAAEAAQQQALEPATDLSELVKARVIKAIPQAPPGKKYAIDPKTLKVVLVNAP